VTTRNLLALVFLLSGCIGSPDVAGSRAPIIGGRVAADVDVGATVALVLDGYPECTGTLVAPRVVVTAAHCLLEESDSGDFGPALSPTDVSVVVGAVDPMSASAAQTHAVDVVWANETFPGDEILTTGMTDEHDIGVLVLARDVAGIVPTPVLDPVLLDDELAPRRMLRVAGYGATDRRGWDENSLLHVGEVPFIERSDRELIAGDPDAVDTCYGDSGGPLYVDTGDGLRLVGVNSRGVDSYRETCDSGTVFTLAPAYSDHIATAIGEDVTRAHEPTEPPAMRGTDPEADATAPDAPAGRSAGASATVRGCRAVGGRGVDPSLPWLLGLLLLLWRRSIRTRRRRPGEDLGWTCAERRLSAPRWRERWSVYRRPWRCAPERADARRCSSLTCS